MEKTTVHNDHSELISNVHDTKLPPSIQADIERYDNKVQIRDQFLWKWLQKNIQLATLSSVDPQYQTICQEQKLRATLFIVLLDDFADRDYHPDVLAAARTLIQTGVTPSTDVPSGDARHLQFAGEIWTDLINGLSDAPRYDGLQTVFKNDMLESCTATEYGDLHRISPVTTYYEYSLRYESPVMLLRPLAMIDLMYSESFAWADFPAVREATEIAQPIFRIGNWLTTWQRELSENDYANGVIARALDREIITPEDLEKLQAEGVQKELHQLLETRIKQADIEEWLRNDWAQRYKEATDRVWSTETVNISEYIQAMKMLFEYQKAGQGMK